MNWSSVKNLLILILVAANIFLLYNIFIQNRTKNYLSESELRDAAEILENRGQNIDISSIPKKRLTADIYESIYPGNEIYYSETAQKLTGVVQSELRIFSMPDGSTRISTDDSDGVFKNVEFTNDFGFSYWISGNSSEKAYNEITVDEFYADIEKFTVLGKTRLAALSKIAVSFLGASEQENSRFDVYIECGYSDPNSNCSYLIVSQSLSGIEVFRHRVVCVFDGEQLIAANGKWYFGTINSSYDYDLYDQISILFTNYNNISAKQENTSIPDVISMSSCYSTYMDPDKTALYFIPAWQIDHSNSQTIVYNAARSTEYYSS